MKLFLIVSLAALSAALTNSAHAQLSQEFINPQTRKPCVEAAGITFDQPGAQFGHVHFTNSCAQRFTITVTYKSGRQQETSIAPGQQDFYVFCEVSKGDCASGGDFKLRK